MKLKDVVKGDWILNRNIPEAKPWFVCCKYSGMVVVRRAPKIGKLTAISARQLRDFEKCKGVGSC